MMAKYLIEPVIGGGQVTSTSIPLATAVAPGTQYFDTAIGTGTLFTSDGISWNQLNPDRLIAQWGIPLILPSSGTLSAAGALSGITALANIYANCFMFFPANAVATVSAAGMYFVQMSSTTAGTVFQNTFTSGAPSVPATAALIPCTTASNYTSATATNQTLVTIAVPANALGPNGKFKVTGLLSNNNSANSKTMQINFGALSVSTASNTTNLGSPFSHEIFNRGVTNAQVSSSSTGMGPTAAAPTVAANDTTAAVSFTVQLQLVTAATDTCQLDYMSIVTSSQQ